jgi:uncharacterized membrane protein
MDSKVVVLILGIMVVFFAFAPLLVLPSRVPDDDAMVVDHPVQIAVAYVLVSVVVLSMIIGIPYSSRRKNKGYQNVVSAMGLIDFKSRDSKLSLWCIRIVVMPLCSVQPYRSRPQTSRTGRC